MKIDNETLEKMKKFIPDTITPEAMLWAEIRMILTCKRAIWRQKGYSEEEIDQLSAEFVERKIMYSRNKNEES